MDATISISARPRAPGRMIDVNPIGAAAMVRRLRRMWDAPHGACYLCGEAFAGPGSLCDDCHFNCMAAP